MLSKALELFQAVSATAIVLFLIWSIVEFVSKVGAFVDAYRERTKMIGAQFAETQRAYHRAEQAARERPKPFAEAFSLNDQIKKQGEAEAQRIASWTLNQQGRPTLPPVSR